MYMNALVLRNNNVWLVVHVIQMSGFMRPGEETCAYLSCDIQLWLDWRCYHNKPPLKRVFDYVVVPLEVLREFDSFKAQQPPEELYIKYHRLVRCNL